MKKGKIIVLCILLMINVLFMNTVIAEESVVGGDTIEECVSKMYGYYYEEDEMEGTFQLVCSTETFEHYDVDNYGIYPWVSGNTSSGFNVTIGTCIVSLPSEIKALEKIIFLTDKNRYIITPKEPWGKGENGFAVVMNDDFWAILEDVATSETTKVRFSEDKSDDHYDLEMSQDQKKMIANVVYINKHFVPESNALAKALVQGNAINYTIVRSDR